MAPPGKASVQKRGHMTRAPSDTPRNARKPRRSANRPNQPAPAEIRDEPPARSTRSWVSAPPVSTIMPTASERVPIDCPALGCRAKTLHQHLPQLQYFHPRSGRAAHYHGYESSNRNPSSRPSLVITLRVGSRDQSTTQLEPEVAEDEPAAQGQRSEEQDSTDDESPTSHSPAAASNLDGDQEPDRDIDRMRNSLPEHRDPTQHEGTSSLFQPPITPPPTSPLATEEGWPSSPDSQEPPEEQSEQKAAASPAPPMEFGDWLPGRGPENSAASQPMPHIHTYDELIRPLVDPTLPPAPGMAKITEILQECQSERDLDMPSLSMRSPLSEYMWQFREESDVDYDYEDFMWQ